MRSSRFWWIRRNYNVPAARGLEITYLGQAAVIVGTRGQYLRIQTPSERRPLVVHPTWAITYPVLPLPPVPRGWCNFCCEERALRKDGTVARHQRHEARHFRPEDRLCPGVGNPPTHICSWTVPATEEAAA